MVHRLTRIAAPLLFAVSTLAACGGAGKIAETVRPNDPTYAGTTGAASTTCSAVDVHGAPMIVDWRPEERLDLEVAMKDGVAVVAYDCKSFRLLKDCRVEGTYGFIGTTTKEQVVRLENSDEIRANLPLSGLKIAATLEGELQRGATLDVALVMIGKKRTTWASVPRGELRGECAGATHFVRGATIGAFAMETGTKAKVRVAAEMFGASASTASGSTKSVRNVDGKMDDCKNGNPDMATPPSQCAALLRLDLTAIGTKSSGDDDNADACPQGLVMSRGKCTRATAETTHACRHGDLEDCTQQCNKGNASSCSSLASMHYSGTGAEKDAGKAFTLFKKACDGDVLLACSNLGALYEKGEGTDRDADRAYALWKKACDGGNPSGCENLGVAYEKSIGVSRDSARAVKLFKVGCDGGLAQACFNLGLMNYKGNGTEKNVAEAAKLYKRACDGEDSRGCVNLGVMTGEGNGVPKDPKRALYFNQRACDVGRMEGCHNVAEAYEEAKGVAKDRKRAIELYKQSCKGGVKESCKKLEELGAK